uniref:MARVEL domain-containing protein n=1 Tax=Bursaphelenchus xylophilus TaxID=6326 RepID=A0A1I7SUV0_BURXY
MGAYVEVVQERTAQQRCDCIASGIELASIIAISVAVCVPWWFTDDAQVSFSLLGFTCKVEEYPCPVVIRVYTTLDDPFLKITFGLVASCIILEAISALVSHCVSCRIPGIFLNIVCAFLAIGALVYFYISVSGYGTFPVYLYDTEHKGGLGIGFYIAAAGAVGLLLSAIFDIVSMCCCRY